LPWRKIHHQILHHLHQRRAQPPPVLEEEEYWDRECADDSNPTTSILDIEGDIAPFSLHPRHPFKNVSLDLLEVSLLKISPLSQDLQVKS
jgi:hypothetical protein